MFKKVIASIIILSVCISVNYGQTRTEIWNKDISYLKSELSSRHKNLFFKTSQTTFDHLLDSISFKIDQLNDTEISIALLEIISKMGDDHTSIYIPNLNKQGMLPINLYWFSDGIYVMNTVTEYEDLLWKKITAIDQLPIDMIVEKISNLTAKTNNAIIQNKVHGFIPFISILKYYHIIEGDSALISYENSDGKTNTLQIDPYFPSKELKLNWLEKEFEHKALCETNRRDFFWFKYIDSTKLLYSQYNLCFGKEAYKKQGNKKKEKNAPSFNKFSKDLISALKSNEVDKFIFDMRYNPGGFSTQGTKLVEQIAKIESINQKGKIFVVVGRKTFSSAILNSLDFQNFTNAIFVGEPTGGKPNHYGEVRHFTLPNHGLRVNYSTKYFTNSQKDTDSFYPDYEISTSFEDFKNGVDPVLEWIIKYY